MAVARWTRDTLLAGWKRTTDGDKGSSWKKDPETERMISRVWKTLGFDNFDGGYILSEDVTLQEFALKHLLIGKAVGGVVVGCSTPEHVLEAIRGAESSDADIYKKQSV